MRIYCINAEDIAELFGISLEKLGDEFSKWYISKHEKGKDVCNETEETFFKHLKVHYDMVK